ncbi:trypsin-like serine protease [Streptomyces sp. C8S0]|uniref:trypsin-like serine protease n=1 Tax=Streptomyces sp. C8S0 TaxID=2585716 RepID=UPI00125D9898
MYLSRRPVSPRWPLPCSQPRRAERCPATALTGADAPAQLNYVAKINVGEQTACTGTLIDRQWVLTAATCFATDGKPPQANPPSPPPSLSAAPT